MSLFWGIVVAGIGAYTMRASFVVLLRVYRFPIASFVFSTT